MPSLLQTTSHDTIFVLLVLVFFLGWLQITNKMSDLHCSRRVVCYYTNWSQYRPGKGRFTPENVDPFRCTHINYAFAKLEPAGGSYKLAPYEWNDDVNYRKIIKLKQVNPKLKVILSVGGWTHGPRKFELMVETPDKRAAFLTNALTYLTSYGFDGLDYDWEYPTEEYKTRFVELIKETRSLFHHHGLIVTAAVSAGKDKIDAGYDVPGLSQYLDFVNLMSYDLHGAWESFTGHNSPLYKRASETGNQTYLNQNFSANYWVSKGAPREKLVLGLAAYGRSFTLADSSKHGMGVNTTGGGRAATYTRQAGILSYYEVCKRLDQGWTRVWHPEHKVPYAYQNQQWVGYDDEESIELKVQYIIDNNLGGAMVWALDLDDFEGDFCDEGNYPLLTLISDGLLKNPSTSAKQDDVAVSDSVKGAHSKSSNVDQFSENQPADAQITRASGSSDFRSQETIKRKDKFKCSQDGLFPDTSDPTKFYSCSNGIVHHMSCPPSLVFNPETKVCDWPQNVKQ